MTAWGHNLGWLSLVLATLALVGLWVTVDKAAAGIGRVWVWWRRDRVTSLLEDCDHEYTLNEDETYEWCQKCDSIRPLGLPPERSREELGFTGELPRVGIVVQESGDGWHSEAPDHRRPGWPVNGALTAVRERRAPWWEAEHRAAYESLGFDYPSGLMARVRELTP